MAEGFKVELDVRKAQESLYNTRLSLESVRKKTLSVIGKTVVTAIRQGITAETVKRTGELRKSYTAKVSKKGTSVTVLPRALNGEPSVFPKVMALSYGSEKRHIKALGFVQRGAEKIDSGGWDAEIEKMIEKELKKYWG